MDKVAVVMSTYNGKAYVGVQIDSILDQRDVLVELYIRDDGSTDGTVELLETYAQNHGNIHIVNEYHDVNLGVMDSFNCSLKYALSNAPDIQYFAFADQDDKWLPEKLISAINMISKSTNEKGALYYSNKIFVDNKLNEIERENIQYYGDYLEILWRALASGCTMVFNRKLMNYWQKYEAASNCIHDSWLYRVAKCIGSDVYFDRNAYILYRQHDKNVCGQKATVLIDSSGKNIFDSIIRRMKPRDHKIQKIVSSVYLETHADMGEEEARKTYIVMNYNRSIRVKAQMLFFEGIRKRPLKTRLLWYNKVLLNMI